jgi:hypothetical protein
MPDERKERDEQPAPKSEEHVSDLGSKELDRDDEVKVKGGRKAGSVPIEY